ncbi:hypothetical protein Sjap_001389 [Stephania japonica]|uniref:HMA domain-containing protein n=1 Tax=Stephania japonica TaxID=461633 RepID=A0AAP0PTG5_9MAGN
MREQRGRKPRRRRDEEESSGVDGVETKESSKVQIYSPARERLHTPHSINNKYHHLRRTYKYQHKGLFSNFTGQKQVVFKTRRPKRNSLGAFPHLLKLMFNVTKDSKSEGGDAKKGGGGGGGDGGSITVVMKVDMHCEGCAKKVMKSVKTFQGVESVEADSATNKLTVKGKVDPAKLRERVEYKTKKKVELVSPQVKKDGGEKKEEKSSSEKKSGDDKAKEKKKEPPVTTLALKIPLHCEGCIKKIRKIITKQKEVQEVTIDPSKDLVTIKGTMDPKSFLPSLKEKVKRSVDLVPPKPANADDKKDKAAAGGDGEKKEKSGGDGGGAKKEETKVEANKMDYNYSPGYGYGYGHEYGHVQPGPFHGYGYGYGPGAPGPIYGYGPGMPGPVHGYGNGYVVEYGHAHAPAPQMFSDENPNACSVM